MAKMWTGRTDGITNKIADDFNSSIKFDSRMYKQDILGSMAHASMLGAKNIISTQDADILIDGLDKILKDIENGDLQIDYSAEDIKKIFGYKDEMESNKKFIAENNKKSLAQVFTDIRYTKKDNEAMSKSFFDFVRKQFMCE
jgi:argininosuccinate lyase